MESIDKTRAIINQINKNLLTQDNELEIFQVIFLKYNFMSISEYAKSHNLTYEGVKHKIKVRTVQFIEIKSRVYLFD